MKTPEILTYTALVLGSLGLILFLLSKFGNKSVGLNYTGKLFIIAAIYTLASAVLLLSQKNSGKKIKPPVVSDSV